MVESEQQGEYGADRAEMPGGSDPWPPWGEHVDPTGFWATFQPNARINARTFDRDEADRRRSDGPIFLGPGDDPLGPDWPIPDDPPPPDDPCAGRPHVRAPLVAMQIGLKLGGLEFDCPSEADRQRVGRAIRTQFGQIIQDPEVRVICADRLLTVGVWPFANAANTCEQQARERGLNALDLIEERENFGFFLNSSLISQQAQRAFQAGPKQLSSNGAPSPFGPIHLTSLSVDFERPNRVNTHVHGYDDRPWPDVGFTVTFTDVIRSDGECASSKSLDTHGAWKAVLGSILLGGATLYVPHLLPLTFFVLAGDLESLVSGGGDGGGPGEGGAGCRALGLVPVDAPLPDGRRLDFIFQQRSSTPVTPGGIFLGGRALPADRTPSATLQGPTRLGIAESARSTFGVYRVETAQTFGTLSFRWSADFGVEIESPTARHTRIRFQRGDRTADSPAFTRTVRVTVTDQDGFETTLAQEVQINVLPDFDLPAVCQSKPWLPECHGLDGK